MPVLIYLGGFLWGFVLIASFAGYGAAISRVLRRGPCDDGLAVVWGLSFLVVLGGVLNLARVISAGLLAGLVLAGVAAWFASGGVRRLFRRARSLEVWDYVLLGALLLGYVNWLCYSQQYEPGKPIGRYALFMPDDFAYTLFPVRMLQTGSMGIDPFNDRLTISALGGESFVQALVLTALPIEYIHLADPGLAYLAIGVMLLAMRKLTGPARLTVGLLFATMPTSSSNTSAIAVPVVLLLGIARLLRWPRGADMVRSSFGVALVLAALLTLKATLIPGGVLVVALWSVILAFLTRRIRPVVFGSLVGLFTLVMMLPGMICSYWSTGTLLYPLLGEGYRSFTLAKFPHKTNRSPISAATFLVEVAIRPQRLVVLAGIAAATVWGIARRITAVHRATVLAVCGSSFLSLAFLTAVFVGDSWRYAYPFGAFAILFTYGTLMQRVQGSGIWRIARSAMILVLAVPIVYYGMKAVADSRELPDAIAGALRGRRRFPPEEIERYRRIQAAVPPSVPFLCLVDWPILFDLARNEILYHDNIGNVSPPPGIPLSESPEKLALYLRSTGIRYVVCFAPAELAQLILQATKAAETHKGKDAWLEGGSLNEIKLYKLMDVIISRYPLRYDDGRSVVIDLGLSEGPPQVDQKRVPAPLVQKRTPGAQVTL